LATPPQNNDLQAYYEYFKKIPTLSKEAEKDLLLKIKTGDEEAHRAFVLANMRLVIFRALRFAPSNRDPRLMDFISDGTLGLFRAIERFDCGRNFRFSTYAVGWIDCFIRRSNKFFQKETQAVIRNMRKKFKTAEAILRLAIGEDPSDDEVALFLKWPDHLLAAYRRHADPNVHVSHDPMVLDSVPTTEPAPHEPTISNEAARQITSMLHAMTPIEEDILRRHFGLGCPEETYKTIAAFYGTARERVRQIENKALRKMYTILKERENPFRDLDVPEGDSSRLDDPTPRP
jgi:RNA polymerase primary sigma factor